MSFDLSATVIFPEKSGKTSKRCTCKRRQELLDSGRGLLEIGCCPTHGLEVVIVEHHRPCTCARRQEQLNSGLGLLEIGVCPTHGLEGVVEPEPVVMLNANEPNESDESDEEPEMDLSSTVVFDSGKPDEESEEDDLLSTVIPTKTVISCDDLLKTVDPDNLISTVVEDVPTHFDCARCKYLSKLTDLERLSARVCPSHPGRFY
jgi:hypothetical protein